MYKTKWKLLNPRLAGYQGATTVEGSIPPFPTNNQEVTEDVEFRVGTMSSAHVLAYQPFRKQTLKHEWGQRDSGVSSEPCWVSKMFQTSCIEHILSKWP